MEYTAYEVSLISTLVTNDMSLEAKNKGQTGASIYNFKLELELFLQKTDVSPQISVKISQNNL